LTDGSTGGNHPIIRANAVKANAATDADGVDANFLLHSASEYEAGSVATSCVTPT
jgi:hypothetical protein